MSLPAIAGLGQHARHPGTTCQGRRGAGRRCPGRPRRPRRGRRRRLGRPRGQRPDGPRLHLPHRLDHEADHRRGGHDARRRRPDRAGGPGRAMVAGAGVAGGGSHAGQPCRRRGPGGTPDHGARPAHVPGRLWLAVGLLVAGGRAALRRADRRPRGAAATGSGRVDRAAVWDPAAVPAGRGVVVRHVLGSPGHPDRARERAAAAGVPRGAPLRAAGHGRCRIRGAGGQARPAHQLLPARPGRRSRAGRRTRRAVEPIAGVPGRRGWPGGDRRRLVPLRPHAAGRRDARRPQPAVARIRAADDLEPPTRKPSATLAPCSWRARAGASAARSTTRRSTHGTCPDATAGSAGRGPRPTSSPPPAQSPSCSRRSSSPTRSHPRSCATSGGTRRATSRRC